MSHTEQHPLANKQVRLNVNSDSRSRALDPKQDDVFTVEGWWDIERDGTPGPSWREVWMTNWAARWYALRVDSGCLPDDDEVLYGKIDAYDEDGRTTSLGHLVHVSELGEEVR